ncbi:MAG: hypothetical protein Q8P64_18190, partial [Deltaproteobacteria bacterium]|nr:hypothetical protein [Deltaproteobacteria bacterium]
MFEAENILPLASSPPKGDAPLSSNNFIDGFNLFNDLLVSSAPTEVTGNAFLCLYFRWMWVSAQERFCGHQYSRRAES